MADGQCPDMSTVDILKATQQRTEPVWCWCRWGAYWCHLANMIEPSVCGSDAALCQITLTSYYYYYYYGPHRSKYVDTSQPYVTYGVAWSVCLSVCLSVCVCHEREPCENDWTDRDAVYVVDSDGPNELHLMGVQIPHAKGQFWGETAAHCKLWGLPFMFDGDAAFDHLFLLGRIAVRRIDGLLLQTD